MGATPKHSGHGTGNKKRRQENGPAGVTKLNQSIPNIPG